MSEKSGSAVSSPVIDEGEIFKSLSHEIRRNIIKALGKNQEMSFSELNSAIGAVDSPTMSYHLKSLKFLVDQKTSHYHLTEIGHAALSLMEKIDEKNILKETKRQFNTYVVWANILTILCWTVIGIIIPILVGPYIPVSLRITVTVLLNVFTQINSFLIWFPWTKKQIKLKRNSKDTSTQH